MDIFMLVTFKPWNQQLILVCPGHCWLLVPVFRSLDNMSCQEDWHSLETTQCQSQLAPPKMVSLEDIGD